jgi:hypothetical protein
MMTDVKIKCQNKDTSYDILSKGETRLYDMTTSSVLKWLLKNLFITVALKITLQNTHPC